MPVGGRNILLLLPRSVESKKIPSLPGANRAYGLGMQNEGTLRFLRQACRERIVGPVLLLYSLQL
jgi:hypothetical protein